MIIAIDFDGTLCTHEYPKIGKDIGAIPVVKKLMEKRHDLILFTMRSGKYLDEAVKWLKDQGIVFYGINTNPSQSEWTKSPKVYANIYIDDASLGIPLLNDGNRDYVDWLEVQELLKNKGVI
jgi:hydroxymethylpyrimidine pyrophosphatase-like HAD family hydrolase